ncbi:MAG: HAMP domain-containing sensor histidine kinase [Acidimicrobiia bacterium]|nr:HAMP domain-containing sensor histidine kinase [Acidimicrobiia bacterium]
MVNREGARKPAAAGLALLVVVTFVTAAAVEVIDRRAGVADWTAEQAAIIEQVMQEAVDGVIADVEAVAAFVEEIGPNSESFESFTGRIEGTESAVGYGYLAAVPSSEFDAFVEAQTAVHGDWYQVFEFPADGGTKRVDAADRDIFYPVQAFAVGEVIRAAIPDEPIVGELGIGLDAGYDTGWRQDIAASLARDGPSISQFISLRLDVLQLDRVFFVSAPVRDRTGSVQGLVVAMMLEPLLVEEVTTTALQGVKWEIVPDGQIPIRVDVDQSSIFDVKLPGATWSVAVAPTEEALTELQGLPWWVVASIAATLVFLSAAALWLYFDRRAEHRRMVEFRRVAEDKDRFLASVSHELRTPLTVVSGLAYELHDEPESFSAEERENLMGMLVEQTDELSGIVEDLLVAARSDIAKVSIHYDNVDLGSEAARAMDTSGVRGTTRGDPGIAYADAQRVRQILRNLLTNAKRYGGPKVRIDFAEGAGWTEIVVADNGEGVPREKREAIFESYESAHAPSSEVRSVGLGLYISRNLARAMGGDLEYVYDGTWSHFRLRLPSAPVTAKPEEDHGSQAEPGSIAVA